MAFDYNNLFKERAKLNGLSDLANKSGLIPRVRRTRIGWPLAKMGHDFPRRYVDETPEEVLTDLDRIFSRGLSLIRNTSGQTVLHEPRVEGTGYSEQQRIDDCAPPSQLPYIKKQIHLEPSRDSETLFVACDADIQAESTLTVVSFETFNNLRTILRWIDLKIYDALIPSGITLEVQVDCQPVKSVAYPNVSCGAGSGCPTFSSGSVTTPTAIDITKLPKDFHNFLYEITDRHQVELIVRNTSLVDRRVSVTLWGWIESVTAWDNAVRR